MQYKSFLAWKLLKGKTFRQQTSSWLRDLTSSHAMICSKKRQSFGKHEKLNGGWWKNPNLISNSF